ncbi:hypothetical protein QEN19_001471 [Hanseniaspora menglaensis]
MIRSKVLIYYKIAEKKLGSKNITLLKISLFLITFFIAIVTFHSFFLETHKAAIDNDNAEKSLDRIWENENTQNPIKIENIFDDTFQLNYQSFKFIRAPKDSIIRKIVDPGLFYTVTNHPDPQKINIVASTLFDPDVTTDLGGATFAFNEKNYQVSSFEPSYDLKSSLIGTNRTTKYRHSKSALYWFRNTFSMQHTPVGNGKFLLNCKYSESYGFLYYTDTNYDLYIQQINKLDNSLEESIRITSDGFKDKVLNGVSDWVYQEEVFGTDNAVWFSPDDSKALYLKLYEGDVEYYEFPKYIINKDERLGVAQQMTGVKYPRPGGELPKYHIHVMNLVSGKVSPLISYSPNNEILYALDWITSNSFIIRTSDRHSSKLTIKIYKYNSDTDNWDGFEIRSIDFRNDFNGFVEKQQPIIVIKKYKTEGDTPAARAFNMVLQSTGFAYLAPDSNGFQQIFLTESIKKRDLVIQLTNNDFDVFELVGFDHESHEIYFLSNHAHKMSKHLSKVNIDSFEVEHLQLCDDIYKQDCSLDYNEIELSSTTRWAYRKQLGPKVPELYAGKLEEVIPGIINRGESIAIEDSEINTLSDDTIVLNIADTDSLQKIVNKFDMPTINFKNITLDDGVVINYKEYLPPGYDKENNYQKFPLLTHVYGAPGSMSFNSKFSVYFESAIASGLRSIVLEIEPRGTGGKGWKFKQWSSKNIGYWEPRDIQEVVKKYIDEHKEKVIQEKVAIWGWSYGGFSTLKTLEYDKGNIFKFGMAVAPVTDWQFYDAIYTERYLSDPNENSDTNGYKNAFISDIEAFKNVTRFLIITGTADDNVHPLNTYKLLDKLNVYEVSNFDMQVFPDSDHNISFHNGNKMVYKKLYTWLENAFNGIFDHMSY